MSEHVTTVTEGGVAHIRIERAEKKNALSRRMYLALADALVHADGDAGVRAVLLSGAGGDFCAGNDMADFRAPIGADEQHPSMVFLGAIHAMRKPVVAAVQGWAVGIGATMLLHCDLVYAAEDARLLFPFVNLGLTPEAGSSLVLPRMMGHQRAAEVLLLGEPLSATRAREYGLVNEVLAVDAVHDRAREIAGRLAAKAPQALRESRALLVASRHDVGAWMEREEQIFKERMVSEEAAEAFAAFAAKRAPDFSRFD